MQPPTGPRGPWTIRRSEVCRSAAFGARLGTRPLGSAELAVGAVRPASFTSTTDLVHLPWRRGAGFTCLDAFPAGTMGAQPRLRAGTVEGNSYSVPVPRLVCGIAEGRQRPKSPYGDGRCAKRMIRTWPVCRGIRHHLHLGTRPDGSAPDLGSALRCPAGERSGILSRCIPAARQPGAGLLPWPIRGGRTWADVVHVKFVPPIRGNPGTHPLCP